MAINFPSNPTNNDLYSAGSTTYIYDASSQKWRVGSSAVADIGELSNVDTTSSAPTDGQALVWDDVNNKWKPGDVATLKSTTTGPPTIQNSSGTEIGTFCRAWVNFNGTGTVAIRAAFNVSSITDIGTGNYRANFITAMPDQSYCTQITVSGALNSTLGVGEVLTAGVLTDSIQFHTSDQSSSGSDPAVVSVAIFR